MRVPQSGFELPTHVPDGERLIPWPVQLHDTLDEGQLMEYEKYSVLWAWPSKNLNPSSLLLSSSAS